MGLSTSLLLEDGTHFKIQLGEDWPGNSSGQYERSTVLLERLFLYSRIVHKRVCMKMSHVYISH